MTTGEAYAIKLFNIFDDKKRTQLLNELMILVSHYGGACETLINFHSAYREPEGGQIGLVIDYMDFGCLDMLMKPKYKITEKGLAAIAFQIFWGLGFLHFEGEVHRDVKPGKRFFDRFTHV